ncbi:hypothetical protein BU17DRAFT_86866 [Hysterangium stoloniferum]|nr:hypothetical protein BU17DRAFT_86866 [Hysterangium stoloniferum]
MVSSALKREHLLIEAAKRARALDKLETSPTTIYLLPPDGDDGAITPLIIENVGINTFSQDPRPALRSLLGYLSDVELARLIATRLSQAEPARPPLYLRVACIEGLHDFLLPVNGSHYISPSPVASTDTSTDIKASNDTRNIFSKVPVTRDDPHGLGKAAGTATPPLIKQTRVRDNCASLLVSIATLLSFLNPLELRQLLLTRIDDSQPPYKGAACFLEFMQSGSDGIPKGKAAMKIRATKRARVAALKRTAKEMADGSDTSITIVSIPQHADPFIQSAASPSRPDTDPFQSHEYVVDTDDEAEEGELTDIILPRSTFAISEPDNHITPTHNSESLKNMPNALPKPTMIADDESKSTTRKRKRKRKSKAIPIS